MTFSIKNCPGCEEQYSGDGYYSDIFKDEICGNCKTKEIKDNQTVETFEM